ncbi:hypothetical protein CABS02_14581 [Colletotrichum abscissum]|uniref:Uncharacterized protein n=1 Tax=Colletotrichum abscissum TaxID=1671311 RepID=A0A9P9X0Z5_9PEZI|nr:hypothetical protein CABS02_14581 [Colletotrichum abscissum]
MPTTTNGDNNVHDANDDDDDDEERNNQQPSQQCWRTASFSTGCPHDRRLTKGSPTSTRGGVANASVASTPFRRIVFPRCHSIRIP